MSIEEKPAHSIRGLGLRRRVQAQWRLDSVHLIDSFANQLEPWSRNQKPGMAFTYHVTLEILRNS